MRKKEILLKYTLTCDGCGKKVFSEKSKKEPQYPQGGGYQDYSAEMVRRIMKQNIGDSFNEGAAPPLPSGWIERDIGQLACSEECLAVIIRENGEKILKKELENYRKKVLKNLKK